MTTEARDALLAKFDAAAWTAIGSYANVTFAADLDDLIAVAEQRGRDQWLQATSHGARQWEGLLAKYDLAEDADAAALIATVRTDLAARVEALEGALAHAEKNLGVIALTLTDHPEYPVKAADVDAARSLARFTAQDIRALLSEPEDPR